MLHTKENVLGIVVISLFGFQGQDFKKSSKSVGSPDETYVQDVNYNAVDDSDSCISAWFKIQDNEAYSSGKSLMISSSSVSSKAAASPSNKLSLQNPDSPSSSPSPDADAAPAPSGLSSEPFYLTAFQEYSLRSLYSRSVLGPSSSAQTKEYNSKMVTAVTAAEAPQIHVRIKLISTN